jgi:signal transduction histidine kinase
MAVHTMNVLSRATVASQVGPKVPVAELPGRVRADSAGIGDRFTVSTHNMRDHFVPESVADAIVSAAVQAMTNSVKHAGGPEIARSVAVEGIAGGGVRVTVEDAGRGFDPSAVASERLGLRVSIIERMHRVGGEVEVRTALGQGATFVLSWPASAVGAARQSESDDAAVLA